MNRIIPLIISVTFTVMGLTAATQTSANGATVTHPPTHTPHGLRIPRADGSGEMVYVVDPDKWKGQRVKTVTINGQPMLRNTNGFSLVLRGATYRQFNHWIHVRIVYSHGKTHHGWLKFKTEKRDHHFDGLI